MDEYANVLVSIASARLLWRCRNWLGNVYALLAIYSAIVWYERNPLIILTQGMAHIQ